MLMVPREIEDAARDEARHVVDRALDGLFGLAEAQIKRRQSYAFAHERAVFHSTMARDLPIKLPGLWWLHARVRRHQRLAVKFWALAHARDPALAQHCIGGAC